MSIKKTATNFMAQYLSIPQQKLKPPLVAPFIHEKITLPNPSNFLQKLYRIRNNPSQLEFVSDFDYTLTKFRHENRQCDSLFGMWVKGEFLPKKFRDFVIANYRQFGPYQTDATISFEERVHLVGELYRFQTKAYQKFRITQDMLEKVLNNGYLVYRSHTVQLLDALQKYNVPLYIISGGISDSIHNSLLSLSKKQYRNISIHSNQLQSYTLTPSHSDDQAQFSSPPLSPSPSTPQPAAAPPTPSFLRFKPTLIHSYNKYKVMNHVNKRKNCFLMGDLVSDIYMAQGNNYQNIISIFYAKEGENDQRAHAERKFDIIVEGDCSHRVIIELVEYINGGAVDWGYLEGTGSGVQQLLV